jgi:hypothetical protein
MNGVLPLPDPKTLQAGDFVWPKKPGGYVPYNSGSGEDPQEDERRWLAEREVFVAKGLWPNQFKQNEIEQLRKLSFREFYSRYAGDQIPDTPGVYASGSGVYVGHVGIIEIDDQQEAWVIEALWGKGVVRHPYKEWIKERPGEVVWQGRVRDRSLEQRKDIASKAKNYLGRPYDFWNFDLSDSSAFYCSKLAWLAIYEAMHFPIDGNPEPKRSFWFSPKQLLYLKTIARLHDPGPYANL